MHVHYDDGDDVKELEGAPRPSSASLAAAFISLLCGPLRDFIAAQSEY